MLKLQAARNAAAVFAVIVCAPSLAQADVGPAPKCPSGLSSSYDMGRFCAVTECSSDSDCGAEKCVERPVCVKPRGNTFDYEGECNGSCGSGECLSKKICTVEGAGAPAASSAGSTGAGATPTGGTPTGGQRSCGCSVPGDDRGWSALVGLGLVVAAGARLARRRRSGRV